MKLQSSMMNNNDMFDGLIGQDNVKRNFLFI